MTWEGEREPGYTTALRMRQMFTRNFLVITPYLRKFRVNIWRMRKAVLARLSFPYSPHHYRAWHEASN